jgi:hypothetical protein
MRLEGLGQFKNPVTSLGTEPATFRLVAYCLNELRYLVPPNNLVPWPFVCPENKPPVSIGEEAHNVQVGMETVEKRKPPNPCQESYSDTSVVQPIA